MATAQNHRASTWGDRVVSREDRPQSMKRRNSIPAWVAGMCLFVLSSSSPATAATRTLQSFQYPNREEGNNYRPPPRVLIDALLIRLHGDMTESLTEVDLGDLLNVLETTASDFLMEKSTESDVPPLEYLKFGRLIQEFRAGDPTTIAVDVENGIARYTDHPAPDSKLVQSWVEESLAQEYLLPRLQAHENANLRAVTSTFASWKYPALATAAATTATKATNDTTGGAVGAILGSLAGLMVVVMGIGGFLLVRKRRNQTQVVNLGEATDDHFKPPNVQNERYGMRRTVSDADARSMAGESESEWTVATEAGDSMAIKSIHPNGIVPSTPNTGALMLSESFERDRRVAITKDMLTSQWSGQVTNQRGVMPSSESVLQPSYFSATVERQNRENRTAHVLPDMDSSSYSSSGTSNTERKKSSSPGKQSDAS